MIKKTKKQQEQSSENLLRDCLKRLGFTVNEKHDNSNEIDIVAIKNGRYFLIEVKQYQPDGYVAISKVNEKCDFAIIVTDHFNIFPVNKNGSFKRLCDFMNMMPSLNLKTIQLEYDHFEEKSREVID